MEQDEFEIEIKREFLTEASEMVEETESAFLDLENNPHDAGIMDRIFRLAHTIKGSAYAAGFNDLAEFAHVFETLLGKLRNKEMDVDSQVVDVLLSSNDSLSDFISQLEDSVDADLDTKSAKELIEDIIKDQGGQIEKVGASDDDAGGGLHLFEDEQEQKPEAHASLKEETKDAKSASLEVVASASSEAKNTKNTKKPEEAYCALIVDDEPGILEILSEVLNDMDFKVIEAADGKIALEKLKSEKIDIILSDIRMPNMDGPTLASEVRKEDENIPIIFITGAADRKDVVNCLNLGAFSLIEKPFEEHSVELDVTNAMKMKMILDAVVKLSSLNFRAFVLSTKIAKMTERTSPEEKQKATTQLEKLLDQIAFLTNKILDHKTKKAS